MHIKNRVLIIANDLKNGGVERVLSVLANHMADSGFDVWFLAIASPSISYPLSTKVHYKYVPIIKIYKRVSLFKEFSIMKKISKEMKVINPEWVIGFDDSIIIRSIPSAWIQKRKILVSERIDPSIYGFAMRRIRQICYDMARHVVFQTEDAKMYFPKRTQKKSVVIPNPLSKNLPARSNTINKDIIMAGRLREQKNVALAIESFSLFWQTHRDYRLVIYGEGEQLEMLKEIAIKKGVENNVLFPGHIDNIHEKMSSCSMYLSTSNYEGISNSMLEALAIGVPSICTDCPVGGARMFIKNNFNGILVPVGDSASIAKSMEMIADNAAFSSTLSKNAASIKSVLDSDIICEKWEKLIC